MENETRFERWLDRALARAQTPRGARPAAVGSAAVTMVAAAAAALVQQEQVVRTGSVSAYLNVTVARAGPMVAATSAECALKASPARHRGGYASEDRIA